MKKTRLFFYVALLFFVSSLGIAQEYFPDIPGYKTLIGDFHTHTVFSDGLVWPTVRVDEAAREGFDVLAISDHIEYQPHRDDLPTNHNRPYEIAKKQAQKKNILLVKAAEITRDTPPGHYNGLFLDDIDLLVAEEFLEAVKRANEQNAFVFWNHHTWKGVERGRWEQVQTTMYENGWLHGMEVANGGTYYPEAHQWCLDKNLTMLGNSDIHQPSIDYEYTAQKHRTLTLVFAKERTVESVEEALRKGCTAVWYKNRLIGKAEYLKPLFDQCVVLSKVQQKDGIIEFELSNRALIDFELVRIGPAGPVKITLAGRSTATVQANVGDQPESARLSYYVKNLLVGPDEGLPVQFSVSDMVISGK